MFWWFLKIKNVFPLPDKGLMLDIKTSKQRFFEKNYSNFVETILSKYHIFEFNMKNSYEYI